MNAFTKALLFFFIVTTLYALVRYVHPVYGVVFLTLLFLFRLLFFSKKIRR